MLAFTGKGGSGKDTAAKVLEDAGWVKINFGDTLKEALARMLDVDIVHFTDPALKQQTLPEFGITPRYAMTTLGTEWGRNMISPDLWLRIYRKRVYEHKQRQQTKFVTTDVRFDNEATEIKNNGGKVVLIVRRDSLDINHESENGISQPDIVVYNDSTVKALQEKIYNLFIQT